MDTSPFQISVKIMNILWRFIESYAVFVLNLRGENLCGEKMTNMINVSDYIITTENGNILTAMSYLFSSTIFHL